LTPQHGGDADAGAKVLRVGGDRQHGLGGDLEQEIVDDGLVLVGDVSDGRRQRAQVAPSQRTAVSRIVTSVALEARVARSITPVLLCRRGGFCYGHCLKSRLFERGYDAHDSFYDAGRGDDPCGRPGHGSTLRCQPPGLPPKVGTGGRYSHRLQLYIMGAVPGDGFGTLGHVFG
jgi:hypothetical protein